MPTLGNLQMQRLLSEQSMIGDATPASLASLSDAGIGLPPGGRGLDAKLRPQFERGFDADLSDVRIHADSM
ncbi:MAG: DUF4157 domain-containing protein [Lysobacter sp.]|nr:DUF4157 domain-containing protein [Lysobacter sp.]